MKQSFENMKFHLRYIQQTLLKYGWDLKATDLPVGTQLGFRELCYALCEWDKHEKEHHISLKERSKHKHLNFGKITSETKH